MFEEIIVMVGFAVFSIVMSFILLKYAPNPLHAIFRCIAVVGIIIHELSHALMCVVTNTRVRRIKLLERTDGKSKFGLKYGGRVELEDYMKLTFLQALLIGLAPLYISFWLFFFLWEQIKNPNLDVLIFFVYIVVMMSLVLSAAPSFADLLAIFGAFQFDWRYSLYQTVLTILSISTVWYVVNYYQIQFFHEIVAYLIVFFGYYGFYFGFKGLKNMYYKIFGKKNQKRIKYMKPKALTRRRVKLTTPERETQW
ncbi:MAG: hypothetical protein E3J90_06290 [Promethearchaeota archaeon]|nr:MAG: hypothetical protein E3J90_06290 [Candidatus Lokiarchaeota archaeon]